MEVFSFLSQEFSASTKSKLTYKLNPLFQSSRNYDVKLISCTRDPNIVLSSHNTKPDRSTIYHLCRLTCGPECQ
jgi:hypothetical protein